MWVSDGTAEGTAMLAGSDGHKLVNLLESSQAGGADEVVASGRLYFVLYDGYGTSDHLTIWSSDGTPPGTVRVRGFAGVHLDLTAIGTRAHFISRRALWRIDGTSTRKIARIDHYAGSELARLGRRVLYTGEDKAHGSEVWATTTR
jgi:hypothetical protein